MSPYALYRAHPVHRPSPVLPGQPAPDDGVSMYTVSGNFYSPLDEYGTDCVSYLGIL
jgi:hypothetical protein